MSRQHAFQRSGCLPVKMAPTNCHFPATPSRDDASCRPFVSPAGWTDFTHSGVREKSPVRAQDKPSRYALGSASQQLVPEKPVGAGALEKETRCSRWTNGTAQPGGSKGGALGLSKKLTLSHKRRLGGMVKQWSMDETQSWFASRSSSQEREGQLNSISGGTSKLAEGRRKLFQKKSTSSAPVSTDTMDGVSRELVEVLRATALHDWDAGDEDDPTGLVNSADGKSLSVARPAYMSLPSPNMPTADDEDEDELGTGTEGETEGEGEDPGVHGGHLTERRGALVPPKMLGAGSDSGRESSLSRHHDESERSSSIVVIPPMQICPGDLLVYSKVLTQRANFYGNTNIDGSTQSLLSESDAAKGKGKSWSLLKMFEREKKLKCDNGGGLHTILNFISTTEFKDSQLDRFAPFSWSDFVEYIRSERSGRRRSNRRNSVLPKTVSPRLDEAREDSVEADAVQICQELLVSYSPEESHPAPCSDEIQQQIPSPNLPDLVDQSERKLTRACSDRTADLSTYLASRPNFREPSSPPSIYLQHSHTFTYPEAEIKMSVELKRREAVWDLFQSESAFLRHHLMALKNVFMEPLKKVQVEGFVMCAEPEVLFGNLDELCCVTYAFCKEFISLLIDKVTPEGDLPVVDILSAIFEQSSKAVSVSKAFHRYALNYINALNYLETLRRQAEFCEFEKWCNKDPRCKKLQLTDLLVAPVHHIMKMPLVLKEIEARTEDPQEKEAIGKILQLKELSLRELDDKMKWLKNFERLLEIQRNVVWPGVMELEPKQYYPEFLKTALAKQPCERLIVSPRRQILMEGPLQLVDTGKHTEMYVILFDDMLLMTRRKKALSKKLSLFDNPPRSSLSENWPSPCSNIKNSDVSMKYIVYKQPLSLDRFFIHDVTGAESSLTKLENAFIIISLNRFQQIVGVYTFLAQSEQMKSTWLCKLRDSQEKWKVTLHHTVFREPTSTTAKDKSC